tara:strand:- start:653 stop:1669 length:1017 start_codon:yes stop_codon:yes gene_type:complete
MGAHDSKLIDFGLDGYAFMQIEASYNAGTSGAGSAIYLPIAPESIINSTINRVDPSRSLSSRFIQIPNKANELVEGSLTFDVFPEQVGFIINSAIGALSNSSTGSNGAKIKDFVIATTGSTIGRSLVITQALGGSTANLFTGCKITGFSLTTELNGNMTCTLNVVGKTLSDDAVVRTGTTFSSTNRPFTSADLDSLTVTPSGVSPAYDLKSVGVNSTSLEIDYGYKTDDVKFGANTIVEPKYNGLGTCKLSLNIDADREFLQYARDISETAIAVNFKHETGVPGFSGDFYEFGYTMTKGILDPATTISNSAERVTQDISYECNFATWKFTVQDENTSY